MMLAIDGGAHLRKPPVDQPTTSIDSGAMKAPSLPFSVMTACQAHTLDLRSLALFRIFLGLYLLYDMYSRLSLGMYDLAWYTSDPANRSFLQATDTPHGSPIHKLWFYRGSKEIQMILFAVTGILATCFCLGLYCRNPFKMLLLFTVTAYQERFTWIDGSDAFSRHLLLWSCFLPVADVWSLDAARSTKRIPQDFRVSGLACLGLTLQVALMYWGTVCNRTVDRYSLYELKRSAWLPPKLSAAHYVVSSSFASRENVVAELIRRHASVSKALTALSMLTECFLPLGCLIGASRRHWFAAGVAAFHAGLLSAMNLPNWQFVGMLTQVVWIPTNVWECIICRAHPKLVHSSYKKTDGDTSSARPWPTTHKIISSCSNVGRLLKGVFFCYMIYNWMGMRGWIPKHDGGNIGEALRLSQHWVMFGTAPVFGHTVLLTGIQKITSNNDPPRFDLFRYIADGHVEAAVNISIVPEDMSARYPSPRWERALFQWAAEAGIWRNRATPRVQHFGHALCVLVNEDRKEEGAFALDSIEVRYQHLKVSPPGNLTRYSATRLQPDTVIEVHCAAK